MKQYSLYLIPLVLLLTGCGVTSSQSGSEKRIAKTEKRAEEFEKTAMLVESGNYIYKVQSVNTGRGKNIQTTAPFFMKARSSSDMGPNSSRLSFGSSLLSSIGC